MKAQCQFEVESRKVDTTILCSFKNIYYMVLSLISIDTDTSLQYAFLTISLCRHVLVDNEKTFL